MAVYYHVPNKDALLDAIVEAVMSEIDLDIDDPAASTEERVVCASRAYLDAMIAHANALPIVLTRGPSTPAALRPVELLLGILREGGLTAAQAMAGMNAIAATVRGIAAMVATSGSATHSRGDGRVRRALPCRRVPEPARVRAVRVGLPWPRLRVRREGAGSRAARKRGRSGPGRAT